MARPWTVLDKVETPDGELELRRRGETDYLITVNGLVLMNSVANRSELALGEMACRGLREEKKARVLVGGLGMACTLRAVLDSLAADATVVVAELNPVVADWCRGPLAPLTDGAVLDPRVRVEINDVMQLIWQAVAAGEKFDAVVFDLYEGPHSNDDFNHHPLYGLQAVEMVSQVLKPGGTFAVWGEGREPSYDKRLRSAGFNVSHERPGRGGLRHIVYLATSSGQGKKGNKRR